MPASARQSARRGPTSTGNGPHHGAARADYPTPDERHAARRYLEHDHAAQTLKGAPAAAANRNAQQLDDEYPRARDIALTGTARELGQLPKHLRAHQVRSRQAAGISTEHAARIRSGYRAGPPEPEREGSNPRPNRTPAAPAPAPRARSSSPARSTQTVRRAASDAAGAVTDTSWGQLILQTFEWGLGLSLAYLVLTKAAGASRLATGAANATRAIVAVNIDPLNPGGIPHAAAH